MKRTLLLSEDEADALRAFLDDLELLPEQPDYRHAMLRRIRDKLPDL